MVKNSGNHAKDGWWCGRTYSQCGALVGAFDNHDRGQYFPIAVLFLLQFFGFCARHMLNVGLIEVGLPNTFNTTQRLQLSTARSGATSLNNSNIVFSLLDLFLCDQGTSEHVSVGPPCYIASENFFATCALLAIVVMGT